MAYRRQMSDLHLITIANFATQWRHLAVDAGADASVTDLGMNGVSKIDGSCALRQIDDLALRRETKNVIRVHFQLRMFQELTWAGQSSPVCRATGEPSDIAYPRSAQLPACIASGRQLPARRPRASASFGSGFRYVAFPGRSEQCAAIGTRSASALRYNHRTLRDHAVVRMDNPQRSVAIFDGCDDDAERDDIGKLLVFNVFALHLPPDGHRPLRPT